MQETQIARNLGIAQAAVSKYLSGNYSKSVKRLVAIVQEKGLEDKVVEAILSKKSAQQVADQIDIAASNPKLIEDALKS
jgi:predicted transcriptional regulator